MSTQFSVDLLFRVPKTPALDQLTKQMKALERASQNIGGQDPLANIGRSATQARTPVAALGASMAGLQFAAAAAGAALATLGIGLIAQQMIQAAGAAQQLAAAFTSLTGSAQEAEKLRDSLFRLSKTTPFQNEDLLQAARGFLAVGVEVDKIEGTINRVGALAASSGQDLGRIALIYSQIYAKGRLQGEENLQLLEAGIDIQQELAQVTGLSGAALQDAMSKGKIGVDAVNKALVLATGNMQGLDLAAKSVAIQWQNLGDNAGQVFLGLSKALSPVLATIPGVFNQAFDKLFPDLATLDKVFAPLLAEAEKFNKLLTDNQDVVDALATAFQSLLRTAVEPAVEGLKQMNRWLEENPDGLVDAVLDVELGVRRAFLTVQGLTQLLLGPALKGFELMGKALQGDFAGFAAGVATAPVDLLKNAQISAQTIGKAFSAERLKLEQFQPPEAKDRAGDLSTKAGAGDAAREATIKKLAELEKDAAKEVRDLNLDYIKEMGEARKDILRDIKALEKDLADQQRESTRNLVDARADLKLQQDIRGLQGAPDEKAYMKARLEEEAAFSQRERDRQRSFEDKQRDLATKLEDFKVKTAETIGNINKKYQERYGEMQRKYAENAAKVLEVGGTNAGKEMVKGALEAARILSSASAPAAGGVPTGSIANQGNPNAKLIADTLTRKLNLSPVAIAGILGNLDYESGGLKNPNVIQDGGWGAMKAGRGYGFAQWTTADRQGRLRERAGGAGLASAQVQADYLAEELVKYFPDALKALRNSRTIEEATKAVQDLYLMPAKATANTAERIRRAQGYLGTGTAGGGKVAGIPVGMTKEQLQTYMKGLGYVRTDSPYTKHKTENHYLNALDMALPNTAAGRAQMKADAARFAQAGYRNLSANNDPTGQHDDHTHFYTPGGKITGTAVPGASAATAGVMPTTTMDLKPAPYPAMPKMLPGPDLTAELAPYNRALDEFRKSEEELVKTLQAADIGKMFNARAAEINAITEGFDRQIEQNDILISQDEKRLQYLEQGINPALAEQFAELDSQFALAEKRLQQEEDYYQLKLGQLNLTEQEKKYYQDILDLIRQRQAALGGQKATIRNQLVEADEKKKAPRTKLLEAIGDKQEKLDDLLNPATQIISAAEGIGDAFGQAFQDIASGSKTAGEALGDMFRSIGANFIQMAAQIAAEQLTLSLLKMLGGALLGGVTGGGGSGFLTGGLFNTQLSFAGGGYTGDGARSGGVDGQGGFPAILHPQETVIDHTMAAPLRPSGEYGVGETATPEINYSGAVLRFNEQDYVAKGDVPKIINASVAATGAKMRGSVSYRKRAGI